MLGGVLQHHQHCVLGVVGKFVALVDGEDPNAAGHGLEVGLLLNLPDRVDAPEVGRVDVDEVPVGALEEPGQNLHQGGLAGPGRPGEQARVRKPGGLQRVPYLAAGFQLADHVVQFLRSVPFIQFGSCDWHI
jgi:hypothetical protein